MKNEAFEIMPFQSAGSLQFLDTQDQIRLKLNQPFTEQTISFAGITEIVEYYAETDVKVLYSEQKAVGAIEFYSGDVRFLDKDLFRLTHSQLKDFFLGLDNELEDTDIGFQSNRYGIGFGFQGEDDVPTSIIVFKENYYS